MKAWDDSRISWAGQHSRLHKAKGRARDHLCKCGVQAKDWAYQHGCLEERIDSRGRLFCTHIDCYQPMCRLCHTRYDESDEKAAKRRVTWTAERRIEASRRVTTYYRQMRRPVFDGVVCLECKVLFCGVKYSGRDRRTTCSRDCALARRSRSLRKNWAARRGLQTS